MYDAYPLFFLLILFWSLIMHENGRILLKSSRGEHFGKCVK